MSQTMRKLTGILAIMILLSEFYTVTHGFHNAGNKRDVSRFLSKRSTPQKCTSTKAGFFYGGDQGPRIDNVNSAQDCLNLCENDKFCYGWQYKSSSNSCWLQTSIGTEYTDPSSTGGTCLGPAAKQKPCTEVRSNMYYQGDSGSGINNVATSKDCMSKCDADPTCLGWSYSSSGKQCWPQTTVYGVTNDTKYMGGSCIIPQTPYPPISIDTYRQQVLDGHNSYRNKHGTPSLKLNSELNTIAQQYAEKLAASGSKTLVHSGNTFHGDPMGENLYIMNGMTQPFYAPGSDPAADWYSEMPSYDWSKPGFGMDTGHFTQLVWKGSTSVGIGRALSKDNSSLFVVANYYPAGNMGGVFPVNVPLVNLS